MIKERNILTQPMIFQKVIRAIACAIAFAFAHFYLVEGALSQDDEGDYLASFNAIMSASYSQVDDASSANINKPPQELLTQCKNRGKFNPTREVTVTGTGIVSTSFVQAECGNDSICILPLGMTLVMDGNLNVGALIVRGILEWTSSTQQSSSDQFLCAGYVVVEGSGAFEMDMNKSDEKRTGWIYIKNNGALHPELSSRSFGSFKKRNSGDNPTMTIRGRKLTRTWSVLSEPLVPGMTSMRLVHDPILMGWKIGDRLGISPTENRAAGWGQDVFISKIREDGTIELMQHIENFHRADFEVASTNRNAALLSAEVVNLSRNIVLTGDDFEEVHCDPNLPEAITGEETSLKGCRCSSFRSKCHIGLHSMQKFGGVTKIEDIRVEKCGQRGVEGKYCLHFHKMGECPQCIFKNNAIENSQQRGIIVHDTHHTQVEGNVLYNVRGANVYLEDGNEMWNTLAYNVAICPFPFQDNTYHGCTIPGTSNRVADTSDNQSGFFSRAGTNNFIGNRASNHFNGMFLKEGSIGRGEAYGEVCESASRLGRMEGNTWHSNGRFGTYTLGFNYPKSTDQSTTNNGYNVDKSFCEPFDSNGETRGLPGSFVNHVDYGNAFVGHYSAGDMQHFGHYSTENNELMYWKETKTFENGCGAHLINAYYSNGNLALPDQATFIIENTVMGDNTKMEANHHCNVGTTGVLCMPTYMMHKVQWKNSNSNMKWVYFQNRSVQPHNNDQNHGGIFTLSPEDAAIVRAGGSIEDSFFPEDYVSLVSDKFSYLLGLPNTLCTDSSSEYGDRYDGGILCKDELRALKIYSRGLLSGRAPQLRVEIWYNGGSVSGQTGNPTSSQLIDFHQVGRDNASPKQGYSFPVIPGKDHSYRISLTNGNLPDDWVIEFSDPVIGNRWSKDELFLSVAGRDCGNNGLITSQHDRKFIWGGNGYLDDEAWSNHGACVGSGNQPPDEPVIDCDAKSRNTAGIIEATQCPGDCPGDCDATNSYCDCGSNTCRCKAGYAGAFCEIDLCADADCGEHGACAARYLGGEIPASNTKCICEGTWQGEKCDKNPCAQLGLDCSGKGTCVALSDTQATCECQDGYFGPNCETRSPCEGFCEGGSFPYFGCAPNIGNKVALGCFRTGGCYYLGEGGEYPYNGFCTYKTYETNTVFSTDDLSPTPAPIQLQPQSTPTPAPFGESPTPSPVKNPDSNLSRCGCDACTEAVWETMADGYTCGSRISFLRDSDQETLLSVGITTGPFGETEACQYVSDEFPNICTCHCTEETTSLPTGSPTVTPTASPTATPTGAPTVAPTKSPTPSPTGSPTPSPTIAPTSSPTISPTKSSPGVFLCGCDECTEDVWNTFADGYKCGDRISFLRDSDQETLLSVGITTGPFDETSACRIVTEEFPDICTCACLEDTESPTPPPTTSPTLLLSPSPFACGCSRCTEGVWNTEVDGHTCGDRISWVKDSSLETLRAVGITTGPFDEAGACLFVTEQFPDVCTCYCENELLV
jgi:hypothetical protein